MPTITIDLTGRLGNILFEYSYLRSIAERDGYDISLPPWIGERVFQIPEAVRPDKYKPDKHLGEDLCQRQECLTYTRKQVKDWFTFKPQVLEKLKPAKCDSEILLNVRQGEDYIGAGMACISQQSYWNACVKEFGEEKAMRDARWETDISPTRLDYFGGNPWSSGLGTTDVCIPSFYRLMTAPILFRANSTFSWWAATLGSGRVFSPVVTGMAGGVPDQPCLMFVEGNWPRMSQVDGFTDLHLNE